MSLYTAGLNNVVYYLHMTCVKKIVCTIDQNSTVSFGWHLLHPLEEAQTKPAHQFHTPFFFRELKARGRKRLCVIYNLRGVGVVCRIVYIFQDFSRTADHCNKKKQTKSPTQTTLYNTQQKGPYVSNKPLITTVWKLHGRTGSLSEKKID